MDQSLWRKVDVESKVDEGRVHNVSEASFTLLDDSGFENILVIANGCVIAVCQVSLEIGLVALQWAGAPTRWIRSRSGQMSASRTGRSFVRIDGTLRWELV